jgi:Flp pilus assembly protein TadG
MYRATMQGKRAGMKIINNNRGAALVFAALFLTFMFLFTGIAIDMGWITYVKNQGQAAVDAAALAGVSAIPDETEVYSRVAAFNRKNTVIDSEQNHLDSSNVTFVTYDGTEITNYDADLASANGVRVAMEAGSAIQTPFFFSVWRSFFDGTASRSADVNVSAIAVVPNRPSLPIALLGCEAGAQDFEFSQAPDPTDTSAFTSFTVQPANTNTLRDMVRYPNTDIPPVEPNKSSICLINGQVRPVLTEIEQKYSPSTSTPSCFLVPVFDDKEIKPNQCKVFQRFAKICITDVVDTGSPKYVQANVESCDASPWQTPVIAAGKPKLVK